MCQILDVMMHPGEWVEGMWLAPDKAPILTLPRMTAEFGGRELKGSRCTYFR